MTTKFNNNSQKEFDQLEGKLVMRSEMERIINIAKKENNASVVYRLSKILNDNPDQKEFQIMRIQKFKQSGLMGAQHKGDYKEALDDCGRLKKGFRFEKGAVIKVAVKQVVKKPIEKTQAEVLKEIAKKHKVSVLHLKKQIAIGLKHESEHSKNKKETLQIVLDHLQENANYYTILDKAFPETKKASNYGVKRKREIIKKPKKASNYGVKRKRVLQPKNEEENYTFSPEDIPYEVAYRAYTGISFSPEKRAKQEQTSYFNYMKEVFDKYLEKAKKTDKVEFFKEKFENFKEGYLKRSLAYLRSRHGIFSSMIAGPSNFPVRRMEKLNNIANNKLNDLLEYSKKGEKYLLSYITPEELKPIKTGAAETLDILKEKLKQAELIHKRNLEGNKVLKKIRANKDATVQNLIDAFINIGFDLETAKKEADFFVKHKYMYFFTPNSNAKVKRIKDQIALEEKLNIKKEQTGNIEYIFNEGVIIDNFQLNKIQILFNEKPSLEIRNFIKKAGQAFKYSPTNNIWQRQLNTYYKLNRQDLFDFLNVEKKEPATVTETKQEKKENEVIDIKTKSQLSLFGAKKKTENTNSLAYRMANRHKKQHEYYNIDNVDISEFLGKIEKKNKESVAITITGGQGSMKTRFCFQLMNAFAKHYKVGHASIEEHPESSLYENKIEQYIENENLHNIEAPEINNINDVHNLVKRNDVIVIDSFSKLQDMERGTELDKDFRKKYDGKLFIIIYQLTTDGKMRGGAKSQFDGDIVSFVEKKDNYKDNYIYFDKNRYQNKNLETLKFNIFEGKLLPSPEDLEKQKTNFSFNIKSN